MVKKHSNTEVKAIFVSNGLYFIFFKNMFLKEIELYLTGKRRASLSQGLVSLLVVQCSVVSLEAIYIYITNKNIIIRLYLYIMVHTHTYICVKLFLK